MCPVYFVYIVPGLYLRLSSPLKGEELEGEGDLLSIQDPSPFDSYRHPEGTLQPIHYGELRYGARKRRRVAISI
jgi:hypothetical protein